jgi:hypothetical protein
MALPDDAPSLEEVVARQKIEERVRAEFTERDAALRSGERDKAIIALVVALTALSAFLLPVWAAILAFSFRVFRFVYSHAVAWPW